MKLLADVNWLHLGRTDEYKEVKKFIANICYDVARAACIDEICINDICVGFRQRGYEVVEKAELDKLTAEIAKLRAEYISREECPDCGGTLKTIEKRRENITSFYYECCNCAVQYYYYGEKRNESL